MYNIVELYFCTQRILRRCFAFEHADDTKYNELFFIFVVYAAK